MSKRRGRGLGLPPAAHVRKAQEAYKRVPFFAGEAVKAAKRGHCNTALDYLLLAKEAHSEGWAHAHSVSEYHPYAPNEGITAADALSEAADAVRRCRRPKRSRRS
jgi:hypothetical protein